MLLKIKKGGGGGGEKEKKRHKKKKKEKSVRAFHFNGLQKKRERSTPAVS